MLGWHSDIFEEEEMDGRYVEKGFPNVDWFGTDREICKRDLVLCIG